MNSTQITKRVLLYIEKNLDSDLSLEKIAKELNYSKFYIARVFKNHTGLTVYKYIRNRRLNEAARKLVQTTKPIIEIAIESGYGSQQAFTQAFHCEYVCSPLEYRNIRQFVPKQDRIDMSVSKKCGMLLLQFMEGRRAA